MVPARYLVPHAPAFEVEVKHYSTMKEIIQDRHAGLAPGGTQEFPPIRGHVSGYSGFQPRCPPVGNGPQSWATLNEINAPPSLDEPVTQARAPSAHLRPDACCRFD